MQTNQFYQVESYGSDRLKGTLQILAFDLLSKVTVRWPQSPIFVLINQKVGSCARSYHTII